MTAREDGWRYPRDGETWRGWGYDIGLKLLCLTDDPRPGWALETAHSYVMSKANGDHLQRAHQLAREAVEAAETTQDELAQAPAEVAAWCTAPAPEWGSYRQPDRLLDPFILVLRPSEIADVVYALDRCADEYPRFRRLAARLDQRDRQICPSCEGPTEFDQPSQENWAWDENGFHRNMTCSECGLKLWGYIGSGRLAPRKSD
jgi:hypothetical protein